MTTQTLLYCVLAGLVALAVSLFYYCYHAKAKTGRNLILAALRGLALFAFFVLLIDPHYEQASYSTHKFTLFLGVDNSNSIDNLGESAAVRRAVAEIVKNEAIKQRFELEIYSFGGAVEPLDSLNFDKKSTNVSEAFYFARRFYKKDYVPLILTDGNATVGRDYAYQEAPENSGNFFLVVGDTAVFKDLFVDRIITNRYVYQDHDFPVEVVVGRRGRGAVNSSLSITTGTQTVVKQSFAFAENEKSKTMRFFLPAKGVGVKQYGVQIVALPQEENTENNQRKFAVEVIDQRAKVVLVYSYLHPDLGTYKKAIESNKLRQVDLFSAKEFKIETLGTYDLIVLFEPDLTFKNIYLALSQSNKNRITIASVETDYAFLNESQNTFLKNPTYQIDLVQPRLNPSFSAFAINDVSLDALPPIPSPFGELDIKGTRDILAYKTINGIATQEALIAVTTIDGRREAIITATGLDQWRSQIFTNAGSFETFDTLIDKLVQYTVSSDRKDRLRVNQESFYYGAQQIIITADYVDKNYVFDPGARLTLSLSKIDSTTIRRFPMILNGTGYQVDLGVLDEGDYVFKVDVAGEKISASGKFTCIPFDVESQATNADWERLRTAAQNSGGRAVLLAQKDQLIDSLLSDVRYTPVQKSEIKSLSLIDFKILLFLIAACLAAEWLIRKYNGLI